VSGVWPGRRRAALAGVVLAAALGAAACSAGGPGGSGGGGRTTLTVSAAASLTEPFTRIARQYEAEHPGVRVKLNFGGSDALAQQVVSGAPVDVFASANQATMDQVERAGRLHGSAQVFARNVLEIAVPPGNPGHVTGLADFANPRLRLAVCEATVPCGAAAQKVFAAAGVSARPDTLENDVKAVLTKVELGEVDAGLVYRTDVRSAGAKVEGVEFPEAGRAVNDYYLSAVSGSSDAARFVEFVRSAAGREVLTQAGFQAP
jgi:molybdate transport system substrate-binding protein